MSNRMVRILNSQGRVSKYWSTLCLLMVVAALAACGGQTTVAEPAVEPEAALQVPAPVAAAHSAVLDFWRDGASICVPQVGVTWRISTDPVITPPGFGVYRYSAGGCDMTVAYEEPINDESTFYVALGDTTTGFCWQALVNRTGQIIRTGNDAAIDPEGNPAAIYCESQGFTYEVRERENGVLCGVCVFPDESVCKGWDYFHGTCAPGDIPLSDQ